MELYHPDTDQIQLPAVLHALSDPQRLRIVQLLAGALAPVPCGSISLDVTKSTATHHFRVLREAGVVGQAQTGTAKLTWLRRDDLDARFPGLLDVVLASAPAPLASAPAAMAATQPVPAHAAGPTPHD